MLGVTVSLKLRWGTVDLEHRTDEDSVVAQGWKDPQSINIQAFQSFKGQHTMFTDNMHRNNPQNHINYVVIDVSG